MPEPIANPSTPWLKRLVRYRAWILVGLTVLFVLVVRVRLRDMPLERDEGEYAYAGQLILQGVPPYKEAYNMKLPGTYAAYALIMAVFGQTPAGIHLGLALINAASIILIFLLGRKILDEITGVVAAVTFALLSTSQSVLGLAGHATHFVVLPALGGILVLLNAEKTRRPLTFFLSGGLFGLAFLMKQHGIFFGVFGMLYLLGTRFTQCLKIRAEEQHHPRLRSGVQGPVASHRSSKPARDLSEFKVQGARASPASESLLIHQPADPPFSWSKSLKELGALALGLIVPYALTCLVLWWAGVLHRFFFWTISYAGQYASAVPFAEGAEILRVTLVAVIGPSFLLWLLPWLGALLMWWERRLTNNLRFLIIAFLLCSLGSVGVGLYFREHYFITLLPALALLSGIAVSRALRLLKHDKTIELFLALPILGLVVVGSLASLIGNGSLWFGLSPVQVTRQTYSTTLFSEAAKIGEYIRSNTSEKARIAVMGSEPEICFYSRRRSATGYIYMYALLEEHPYGATMQQEMITEIEAARPEYLVYVDDNFSWLPRPNSNRKIFEWWQTYWPANFEIVKTIKIEEGRPKTAGFYFSRAADEERPTVPKNILLFKRKLAPKPPSKP
jgi:hypothetical protein